MACDIHFTLHRNTELSLELENGCYKEVNEVDSAVANTATQHQPLPTFTLNEGDRECGEHTRINGRQ